MKIQGHFSFEGSGLTVDGQRNEDGVSVMIVKNIKDGPIQRIYLNSDEAHAMYNLLDVVLEDKD